MSLQGEKEATPGSLYYTTVKQLLIAHEGRRKYAYRDTRGKVTVGVGFNLDNPSARAHFTQALHTADFDGVYAGKVALTDEQIDLLLDHCAAIAEYDARRLVPSFDSQPENVRLVLIDMSFNMGRFVFSQFKRFLAAIESEHYAEAIAELRSSRWFNEVGKRAEDDIALLSQVLVPNRFEGAK